MLDNLRDEANSQPFFQDDAELTTAETTALPEPSPRVGGGRFLGMTPMQRFIISVMLLIMVCIISFTCLWMTNSIGIYL
ncbi:MAG: hypothetical protein HY869_21250 [Chloroflexi bacterium]|nr:hypothetical protein [Chloroflexota bacterium]